jgi:hypothetical protein
LFWLKPEEIGVHFSLQLKQEAIDRYAFISYQPETELNIAMMSLVVGKIGIYRKGNDIKLNVILRHEGSPEVLFLVGFIIS